MDPKIPLELPEAPMYDPEQFKIVARYRKAKKLTAVLLAHGAVPENVDSAVSRRLAEQLAEVNASSDVTWALVREMLREAL